MTIVCSQSCPCPVNHYHTYKNPYTSIYLHVRLALSIFLKQASNDVKRKIRIIPFSSQLFSPLSEIIQPYAIMKSLIIA